RRPRAGGRAWGRYGRVVRWARSRTCWGGCGGCTGRCEGRCEGRVKAGWRRACRGGDSFHSDPFCSIWMAYSLISGSASSSSGTCWAAERGLDAADFLRVAHGRRTSETLRLVARSSTPSSRWRCWTPRRRSRSAVCAQRVVRRFVRFSGLRHPRELGEGEVTRFLSCLAVDRRVSASTQNQALSALVFLYRDVMDVPVGWLDALVRAKRPERVPVVLTRDEV